MKNNLTWSEAHDSAATIPCGNAYCAEGNCTHCEIQIQLRIEQKLSQGFHPGELTATEQIFLAENIEAFKSISR